MIESELWSTAVKVQRPEFLGMLAILYHDKGIVQKKTTIHPICCDTSPQSQRWPIPRVSGPHGNQLRQRYDIVSKAGFQAGFSIFVFDPGAGAQTHSLRHIQDLCSSSEPCPWPHCRDSDLSPHSSTFPGCSFPCSCAWRVYYRKCSLEFGDRLDKGVCGALPVLSLICSDHR